ncbi:flavodoxin [Natronoflexus pectinivorans]|uniref:Flavodoxin n=1 Tax=Natronoflexus pectinivorans TaxID=682526 RepID=A0A4R2GL07_9BACT|nr:flavodoxin [Natronoflexus pectinivorans]TCO09634.1 flavodoxin I [Natronoflexus pectinivorans]
MNSNILIVYGSSLGNTRFVAEKLQSLIQKADLKGANDVSPETIKAYSTIILGTSTWGVGMLQDDFETFVEMLVQQDLSGKTIALFGLGDQQNYPDTFCDGMGKLYELLQNKGVKFIGEWPADEYDFASSKAYREGMFVGLALDEDNEPDLSDYRIEKWAESIRELL